MAAAATALAAAADGSVVDGCIRAGGSVDAKDDGAATAESEGAVDRMAAAAPHWRRQLTVASSMMPGPTARPRRKLMTQPRLREAAQGLAVQATPRVTARLTAMAMAHGEAKGNGSGPAHAECNCAATCIGAKDASQPTVTAHKLTVAH